MRHIFQVSGGKSRDIREFELDVPGEIFNEFATPNALFVDDRADVPVERDQLAVRRKDGPVLRRPDFQADIVNNLEVVRIIYT